MCDSFLLLFIAPSRISAAESNLRRILNQKHTMTPYALRRSSLNACSLLAEPPHIHTAALKISIHVGSRARLSSRPPHQCKRRRLQFMKLVANFNLRATAQINSNAYQSIFRPSKIRNRWRQARKSESSPQRVDTERSHSKCTLFFPSVGNTEYWSGYYNNNKVCEQRDQKKQQAQRNSWDLMVNAFLLHD